MHMNISTNEGYSLSNIDTINVIIGRNGAGKSIFLRSIYNYLYNDDNYNVRYVSPERAGTFKREGYIITQMESDPHYLFNNNNKNQVGDFKSISANLFRELEIAYLRKVQSDHELRSDLGKNFSTKRVSKVNSLFNNIYIKESGSGFEFFSLSDDSKISPDNISSGESEVISLCTEIMYLFDTIDFSKINILIIDEPDVHLHPDLQCRLTRLLTSMIEEYHHLKNIFHIIISTHSSAMVSSLIDCEYCSVGTKNFNSELVVLGKFSNAIKRLGPLMGHSLSLYLSNDLPLILEGDDDDRVWQQVCRTSQGKIRLFPVVASSVSVQTNLEHSCNELMSALYDSPKAISIRDGDGIDRESLEDIGIVKRFSLNCYEIENLLVTDECLRSMGHDWNAFTDKASIYISQMEDGKQKELLSKLIESDDRLQNIKIKSIRNLVLAVCDVSKPWEVVVGQTISSILCDDEYKSGMMLDFIGKNFLKEVCWEKDWG